MRASPDTLRKVETRAERERDSEKDCKGGEICVLSLYHADI